jgi:hypothetical protein
VKLDQLTFDDLALDDAAELFEQELTTPVIGRLIEPRAIFFNRLRLAN